MADVSVFYDPEGATLTVWFGDPRDEDVCEETGEEVLLMKDQNGRVIGFEKLNYSPGLAGDLQVAVQTLQGGEQG